MLSYESGGGHLTAGTSFGIDPLAGHPELQRDRQLSMEENLLSPDDLFSYVVNGSTAHFAQSLRFMIDKSIQLQVHPHV